MTKLVKIAVPYPHPQLVPFKPGPVVREVPAAEAAKLVAEGKAWYIENCRSDHSKP